MSWDLPYESIMFRTRDLAKELLLRENPDSQAEKLLLLLIRRPSLAYGTHTSQGLDLSPKGLASPKTEKARRLHWQTSA